jgi:AcrR family transcriptional regulator
MPRKADEQLEGRIVDAAYQLWSRGGERALTMRAVALAAKTTTPTLYERFNDKHDLLVFMREKARQRMFQAVQPAKTAAEVCQQALKFSRTNGNEYSLLLADWAVRLGRKEPLPSFEHLKGKLAQDLGGSAPEYGRLAMSLVALIHGTAIMLLGQDIEGGISEEFEKACLEACKKLIEAGRNGAGTRGKT